MRLFSTCRRWLRARTGQSAIEFLGALMIWIVTAFLFLNILAYFGSAMLVDSALDRVALRTSSYGCYDPSILNNEGLDTNIGFGIHNMQVVARATGSGSTVDAPGATDENYYQSYSGAESPQQRMLNSSGALTSAAGVDATCGSSALSSTDGAVPAGAYIVLQATYQQSFMFIPGLSSGTVHRTVTVVSNSLENPNAN